MKMRMLAVLLCLLMGISSLAAAEAADKWTSAGDLYYHAAKDCGGTDGRVPISASSAEAFDKYACPVCTEIKTYKKGLSAVARGGTIVLRFTEEWLNAEDWKLTGVFAAPHYTEKQGMEAKAAASELLNGEALLNALAGIDAGDMPETYARVPFVFDSYDWNEKEQGFGKNALMMNQRHINGCWYFCIRPDWPFDDECEIYWRIENNRMWMENGTLFWGWDTQTGEEHRTVKLEKAGKAKAVHSAEMNGLTLEIFDEMDTHIAVIHEHNADKDLLRNVRFSIGGGASVLDVEGYMNGTDAIYCCVLSEGEYQAVKSGAQLELQRDDYTEGAEYYGDYAVVRKGTAGEGIINRSGEFVVQPQYQFIYHVGGSKDAEAPSAYICQMAGGSYHIRDGATFKVTAEYLKDSNKTLGIKSVSPAVYQVFRNSGADYVYEYHSLETNELLFTRKDICDALQSADIFIDSGAGRVIEGMPQRLVAYRAGGSYAADSPAWLIDNHGKVVTKSYSYIYPLFWKGDQGVYLVESFDPSNQDGNKYADFRNTGFPMGRNLKNEAFGENYRCGLIDQDGNVLADMEYSSFTIVSEDEIWMGREDGFTIIELPWV